MSGSKPTKATFTVLRAANELVKWRRHWERAYGSPPDAGSGFADILALWKVAGELMELRGQKRRMPG